ncbi:MAG: RNA methyltransferase [Lachnospiraceae bacterium]|nr:RNA methyltransferase [Lachnospiraceae bacterium]
MIESKANQQIKNVLKLKTKARERKKQKVFLIEGIRMFMETPADRVVKAYATADFYNQHSELFKGMEYELVTDSIFKEISDTVTPQGVLAIIKQPEWKLKDILSMDENPCLILLENLQDPGNLGTIIRTSEGAGVTGIIMSKDTVDIYNPKVIRSTMGSIYRVPFVYVENLKAVVEELPNYGIHSYAARLDGENVYESDFRDGTAFLIGNEGNGLTDEISEMSERYIKIPMHGKVESLNAAIASTVLMYEAMRQRL